MSDTAEPVSIDAYSQYGVTVSDPLIVGYAVWVQEHTAQSHKRKELVMKEKVRFLGLDVHAETITVAVAEPNRMVRYEVWERFRTAESRFAS